MTEQTLLQLGFIKIVEDSFSWFELETKKGKFLTNDNMYNENTDEWHLGYQESDFTDPFWFNNGLKGEYQFRQVFSILLGMEFKLYNQRKLKEPKV